MLLVCCTTFQPCVQHPSWVMLGGGGYLRSVKTALGVGWGGGRKTNKQHLKVNLLSALFGELWALTRKEGEKKVFLICCVLVCVIFGLFCYVSLWEKLLCNTTKQICVVLLLLTLIFFSLEIFGYQRRLICTCQNQKFKKQKIKYFRIFE